MNSPERSVFTTMPARQGKLCHKARGFTLIEVVVALAIVSILLTTLLYTLNLHLSVASTHETVTRAVLLARQKLVESRHKGELGDSGRFAPPYEDYAYVVTLSTVTLMPGVDVLELAVTVTGQKERVVLKEALRSESLQ